MFSLRDATKEVSPRCIMAEYWCIVHLILKHGQSLIFLCVYLTKEIESLGHY